MKRSMASRWLELAVSELVVATGVVSVVGDDRSLTPPFPGGPATTPSSCVALSIGTNEQGGGEKGGDTGGLDDGRGLDPLEVEPWAYGGGGSSPQDTLLLGRLSLGGRCVSNEHR